MNMITAFLQPYLSAIVGAAFSLQQALEGLKIHGSNFLAADADGKIINSYWSANEAVALPLLGLLAFVCVLILGFLAAIRVLAGVRGLLLGSIALAVPGLLSLAGVWPTVQWLPRSYNVGSGELGSPWGMFALLAIALGTGWTSIVLLSKLLQLDDRFRHGYDQFWYAMAISAGLFFVADMGAAHDRERLRDSAATSQAASGYLLAQMRRLDAECELRKVQAPVACQWAKKSQWNLEQYVDFGYKLYWQLGPENSDRLYAGAIRDASSEEIQTLRQELHQYNLSKCPVKSLGAGVRQSSRVSRTCQITPASFCIAYPDIPLKGVDPSEGILHTVAIANECVVPALVALKVEQTKLAQEVTANARARHLRWLLFLFTALVAGGKVANASIRMFQAIYQARTVQTPIHQSEPSVQPAKSESKTKKLRRRVLAPHTLRVSPQVPRPVASAFRHKRSRVLQAQG